MRKIIQIVNEPESRGHARLYALCNDGSIWFCEISHAPEIYSDWQRMPGPPAPADEEYESIL